MGFNIELDRLQILIDIYTFARKEIPIMLSGNITHSTPYGKPITTRVGEVR
jgi:hypothetical protein